MKLSVRRVLLRSLGFGFVAWQFAGCTLSQGVRRLSFDPPEVIREVVPPRVEINRRTFDLPYLCRVKIGYYFDESFVIHLNHELHAAGVDHVVVQSLVSHRFELHGIPWHLADTSGFRAVIRLRKVSTGEVFDREFSASCAGPSRQVWSPNDSDWLIPRKRIDEIAQRNSRSEGRSENPEADLTAANMVNVVGVWTRALVAELSRERDPPADAAPAVFR